MSPLHLCNNFFFSFSKTASLEGEDYQVSTSVITIPALIARGCLTVEILASAVVEGEEEIHMRINETTTEALIVDGETVVAIAHAADRGMYLSLALIHFSSIVHMYIPTSFISFSSI